MNNDLEQFSEERLKEILNLAKAIQYGNGLFDVQEIIPILRIALAVKQAKPVACKFGKNNGDGTYTPTYDYWPLPSYIKPHKDWPVTLFYDAPQPAIIEQTKPFKYFIHVMDDGVLIMKSIPDDSPLVKIAMPLYTTPQPAHREQDGWTSSDAGNAALVMLERIDTTDPVDDDRIEEIKRIIRQLTTTPVNSQVIPDGWTPVPIEPTEAMKKAYYDSSLAPISKLSVTGYRALVAAAPKPESE